MLEITNKSKEQKVAESEVDSFRKGRGPFVVAAETTRMAMVFTPRKLAIRSFLPMTAFFL